MYDLIIIGFGVSGISMAREAEKNKLNYLVIEKQKKLGGCWNNTFNFTSLQTDKKFYEFDDFSMPQDYPIYPNKMQILNYLQLSVDQYDIEKNVYYNTKLIDTQFCNIKKIWSLTLKHQKRSFNLETKFIAICNGFYNKPNLLKDVNYSNFLGEIYNINNINDDMLHKFKNKNIVIVGNGASSCDFITGIKDTAKHIIVLYRSDKYYLDKFILSLSISIFIKNKFLKFAYAIPVSFYIFLFKIVNILFFHNYLSLPKEKMNHRNLIANTIIPKMIEQKKLIYLKDTIVKIDKNKVFLKNDILFNIDIIVLALGYKEDYEFLNSEYKYDNRYEQIININIPNCGFIGLSPSYNWLQTSSKQAKWFIEYMKYKNNNNNLDIFNIDYMKKHIEKYKQKKEDKNLNYNDLTYEIFEYLV